MEAGGVRRVRRRLMERKPKDNGRQREITGAMEKSVLVKIKAWNKGGGLYLGPVLRMSV